MKFCKEKGDIVVLGLNSDSSLKQIKGPDRPISSQSDRAHLLSDLEMVDYVVIFDEDNPLDLIEQIAPDVLIKGADRASKDIVGREYVESNGGKTLIAPLVEGQSTTSVIKRIQTIHNPKLKDCK